MDVRKKAGGNKAAGNFSSGAIRLRGTKETEPEFTADDLLRTAAEIDDLSHAFAEAAASHDLLPGDIDRSEVMRIVTSASGAEEASQP